MGGSSCSIFGGRQRTVVLFDKTYFTPFFIHPNSLLHQ